MNESICVCMCVLLRVFCGRKPGYGQSITSGKYYKNFQSMQALFLLKMTIPRKKFHLKPDKKDYRLWEKRSIYL